LQKQAGTEQNNRPILMEVCVCLPILLWALPSGWGSMMMDKSKKLW